MIEAARQEATGGGAGPTTTLDPGGSATPSPTTPDPGTEQPVNVPPAVTLLLSDGANSAGGDPFIQAERARQLRVPVYTIALGTANGVLRQPNAFGGTRIQPVPPDPDSLARIAETTNGRFFEAPTSDNLTAVYDSRVAHRLPPRGAGGDGGVHRRRPPPAGRRRRPAGAPWRPAPLIHPCRKETR